MAPPFATWALGSELEIIWYMGEGRNNRAKLSEDLFFFLLFTCFWGKYGTNFERKPFFFALHPFLGKIWDEFWAKTFFFALHPFLGKIWDEFWVWLFKILIYVSLKFPEVSAPPPPPHFKILRTPLASIFLLYIAVFYLNLQIRKLFGVLRYSRTKQSKLNYMCRTSLWLQIFILSQVKVCYFSIVMNDKQNYPREWYGEINVVY